VTSWLVVSPRLGVPGSPFVPKPGVNVAALVASGAIVEVADILDATAKDAAPSNPSRKVTRKTPKE
jgi:hypothetical protein